MEKFGKVYMVATPIGNLKDITLRALDTLNEVDLILAESISYSKRLLNHYGIRKPLLRFNQHNEKKRVSKVMKLLNEGKSVAYISNAGSPGISDPGAYLVSKAYENGIQVVPIPGPSAITAALSVCGIPSNSFIFLGFLPRRKGKRKRLLESIRGEDRPVVLFESPNRILGLLPEIREILGKETQLVILREMTKAFEEIRRGDVDRILEYLSKRDIRGEITIVLRAEKFKALIKKL
ncbi:MAG TPA: 16S rRNA (cytidine(1402)-2'-O)-methyltransferase [Desulfobacteraceae bacterium]|nr:16S rRNA (cytidine(1402)-2'-O)-methyltransferase [Desulfobacteraceae bacterium]